MESTIRLFKALPIENNKTKEDAHTLERTLKMGFVLSPSVIANYDIEQVIKLVNDAYGKDPEELNKSFHKSWAKVRDASIEQLVMEQIVHYITTYGFESLGIYSEDSVYIPSEELNAPQLEEGIRLVVIRGLTKSELKEKLLELLSSGIALSKNTLTDVLDVATFVGIEESDIEKIKNKEAKVALLDYLGLVPSQPVEFLRYIVYKSTDSTLLIKNQDLIDLIKSKKNLNIAKYFDQYEKEYGLGKLAEIFYRFKPIFLAFRTNTNLKRTVNKIRRLAETNHKPMPEDLLNSITERLKNNRPVSLPEFSKALLNANTFRKIRLAYALKFRAKDAKSIQYRVRNGKSWATDFSFENKKGAEIIYKAVMESIVSDVSEKVKGKKIYIPENLYYGLPATEKQFTGNLPSGTYVEVADDMVAGVYWKNVPRHRIDLDLSLVSVEGKIGWDGAYRRDGTLFSGDITDAPKGASELFYVSKATKGIFNMFLNFYNHIDGVEVPYKILVSAETPVNPTTHYTVDSNKLVALSNSSIEVKQKSIGLLVAGETNKFYFAESGLGKNISSSDNEVATHTRNYLVDYYTDAISLNEVLRDAGAKFVSQSEAEIDLSPEAVDKTTIIGLL